MAQAPTAPVASARIQAQGAGALEQLDAAMRGRKPMTDMPAPALPDIPPVLRKRAFDALGKRAPATAMAGRARDVIERGQAGVAAERDRMLQRLDAALGLQAPDLIRGATRPPDRAAPWVPVLFVSSSIPVPVLRSYASQLEAAKGVMVLRGMPGGLKRVAPMAALAAAILRRDAGCEGPACVMRDVALLVDPLLFRQNGIARVPALAMLPGDPARPYCERDGTSPPSTHIVYGDSALSGLLEYYARLGGTEEVRDARARLDAR